VSLVQICRDPCFGIWPYDQLADVLQISLPMYYHCADVSLKTAHLAGRVVNFFQSAQQVTS